MVPQASPINLCKKTVSMYLATIMVTCLKLSDFKHSHQQPRQDKSNLFIILWSFRIYLSFISKLDKTNLIYLSIPCVLKFASCTHHVWWRLGYPLHCSLSLTFPPLSQTQSNFSAVLNSLSRFLGLKVITFAQLLILWKFVSCIIFCFTSWNC